LNLIYSFLIFVYGFFIRVAAIINNKARQWVAGRQTIFQKLELSLRGLDRKKNPVIWVHASSLGEFEQGRPVIEAFRKSHGSCKILLTFFSPSGYEVRKNYDQADWVFYLPLDTPGNARRWIETVQPVAAIFIKYDFWFNFLQGLYKQNIPVYFISALFRPRQHFFRWYGGWFARQLSGVTHFFVQNSVSAALLENLGIRNVTIAGDTRFDRVFTIASQQHSFPLIERFISGKKVFIGGSTWKEDELLLLPLINRTELNLKFILAPHDTDPGRIQHLIGLLQQPVVCYSELNEENALRTNILIIDSVGILAQLYRYATLAYIGGGFGVSIHNIQEPITYGVPVFFGPQYHKFKEAVDLIGQGAVFSISTPDELVGNTSRILSDPLEYQHLSSICRNYVDENRGATAIIMHHLNEVFR